MNKLEKAIKILEDFNFDVELEQQASTKVNKVFSVIDRDGDIDQEIYNEKTLIDRSLECMYNNNDDGNYDKEIAELEK